MNDNTCRFCGRPNEDNPGDHYHYHDCWRKDVIKRMEGVVDGTPEMAKLERELWQASYTGD